MPLEVPSSGEEPAVAEEDTTAITGGEDEPALAEEEALAAESIEGAEAIAEPEEVAEVEEIEAISVVSDAEAEEPAPPWVEKLREVPAEELPKEGPRLARGELPEWLEIPPEFEEMMAAAAPAVEGEEIAPAEIPSWLDALRPREEEGVGPPEEPAGPVEPTGLLKGIKGALAIEPTLAIPRRAKPVSPFALSTLEAERARAFDRVASEPAREKAEMARPRRVGRLASATLRWLIYLVIVIAVVVPIALGSNWSAAYLRVSEPTAAMYDTIEGLDPGSVVVISHDYTPGVAAEMVPQARAVVHHLMQREARLVSVSLTPEGSRLGQRVLQEVAWAHAYDEDDYLDLGYVVGVEAGPRSVVEGLLGPGGADFVGGVDDIALIVELAGGPESLRLWLEQVQGLYQIPMVAGVSATADPFARPYYHNEARQQLQGLMIGLVGAAEYERRSGQPGWALASMDSQSLVHLSIVLLIVLGNVAYLGGRLRKR